MKITKLKRIENFEGILETEDEVEFKNFNIIFGDNGSGKSRVVRALSAFAENLKITKHYFHENEPSNISLEIDGSQYSYDGDGYDKELPENFANSILVFDTDFISENLNISANEKGEKLITIAGYNQCFLFNNQFEETIKKLVNERDSVFSSDLKTVMAKVKSRIQNYGKTPIAKDLNSLKISNGRSYDWKAQSNINKLKSIKEEVRELNIISDDSIDAKKETIEKLDSRIKSFAEDKANLEDLLDYEYKLEEIEIDLTGLSKDFKEFLSKIEKLEYLSDYRDSEISFIKTGIKLLQNDPDLCPFCKQELIDKEQTELIEKYKEVVKGLKRDYQEDFKRSIQEFIDELENLPSVDSIYPEKYLSKLHFVRDLIEDKPKKWNKNEIEYDKIAQLKNFLEDIVRLIEKGFLSNIEMPSQRLLDRSNVQIKNINKYIAEVKSVVKHNEELFKEVKNENYSGGKEELEKKKNEAKEIVTKNSRNSEFKELIPNLNLLIKNLKECAKIDELIKSINDISDQFTSELENEINSFSEDYVKTIQKYYKHFQPDGVFNLIDADASTSKSGGRFKLNFEVSAKSQTSEEKDGKQPSDVLSDGNYNSLALAYFFALVEKQGPDIVIFDDPITGMDSGKRLQLIGKLIELSESKQVFVLTHDILFKDYLCDAHNEYINTSRKNINGKLKATRYYNLYLSEGILKFLENKYIYEEIIEELEALADKEVFSDLEIHSAYSTLRLGLEYFLEKRLIKNIPQEHSFGKRLRKFKSINPSNLEDEEYKLLKLIHNTCSKSGPHLDSTGGDTISHFKSITEDFLKLDKKFSD